MSDSTINAKFLLELDGSPAGLFATPEAASAAGYKAGCVEMRHDYGCDTWAYIQADRYDAAVKARQVAK